MKKKVGRVVGCYGYKLKVQCSSLDNTVIVNQIVTIFLIKSSIHIPRPKFDIQTPPSPDYVSGPEYLPLPEFIPELVYPEYMPPKDDILSAEEKPLPSAASPITESPGYIDESDPEEDPEVDPANYPVDGGDDNDDDESSNNDAEDDDDVEDEEEEEHLAPADSTAVALPAVDHALSAEETEPFEIDECVATPPPHPAYRVTARMSIRPQTPISFPLETEIARLIAILIPPSLPLSL
nr:hypothetical protein [Tanacetum cinerariifolium]